MTHFFNNKQVLMENVSFQDLTPKLFLFAIDFGGAYEAVNLVFCNVNSTKYTGRIIKEVQNANKKILSIFIHSYYKEGKKSTPRPIMNKKEPKIK